jgi:hypothetical protein
MSFGFVSDVRRSQRGNSLRPGKISAFRRKLYRFAKR